MSMHQQHPIGFCSDLARASLSEREAYYMAMQRANCQSFASILQAPVTSYNPDPFAVCEVILHACLARLHLSCSLIPRHDGWPI
jgi:hypothetical protein